MPKVAFGRLNRRASEAGQDTLQMRSLKEDFGQLLDLRETRGAFQGREWVAADLEYDASGDFAMGVLGFVEEELFRQLDESAFSWRKGETLEAVGATQHTMAPFAVDLREDRRWIGFVVRRDIRHRMFANSLSVVLTDSAARAGQIPLEWEIDLVATEESVAAWLDRNPEIKRMTRIIKFPNPAIDFDEERKDMQKLAARTRQIVDTPYRGRYLSIPAAGGERNQYLEGVSEGYLEIRFDADSVAGRIQFSTATHGERFTIDTYGDDLELGMRYVLDAVREFSLRRGRGPGEDGKPL